MKSNEVLHVGTDGKVLVCRYKKADSIEMFALVRGECRVFIRRTDRQVSTVDVLGSLMPVEVMEHLAKVGDGASQMSAVETLEHLRRLGHISGVSQYLEDDPFDRGWRQMVETEFEKAVAEASRQETSFVLEL